MNTLAGMQGMMMEVFRKLFGDFTSNQFVSVILFCTVVSLMYHLGDAAGSFPNADGFSRASETNEIKEKVNSIEINLVNKDLVSIQERWCNMTVSDNRDAIRYTQQIRASLQEKYFSLSGKYPLLPTCADLGIREQ